MEIKQFYDKTLAHGSYAIVSDRMAALVDPGRDPQPYLDFAEEHKAEVVAVFETHPHADFVSSHLEFCKKHGATLYTNSRVAAEYPHQPLNDDEEVSIGSLTIRALFTPGHSPDHNSYLLFDAEGQPHAVFTGDALFVGDVGRPDLRKGASNGSATRQDLARQMYHSVRQVFEKLADGVIVYPAHRAGSLCGKNMGSETASTIGQERSQNWAFSSISEKEFVDTLLENPPFIPQYFSYDVELNRRGAPPLSDSLRTVPSFAANQSSQASALATSAVVVDVRSEKEFKQGHTAGAINIQEGDKFETWLGALIAPQQPFYLLAADEAQRDRVVRRAAKIGYEPFIQAAMVAPQGDQKRSPALDLAHFQNNTEDYTIVDVRNAFETDGDAIFAQAVNIPLPQLPGQVAEVDSSKPVVVHCASGYRSAAGASILEAALPQTRVYDLSDAVKRFS